MSFECQICAPPFQFDRYEDAKTSSLTYFIGSDKANGVTFFVTVFLNYGKFEPEYGFAILERNVPSQTTLKIHSGIQTKSIFSDPMERQLVLMVVLQATAELLDWKRPEKVFRCAAFSSVKNQKSMMKHNMVSWVFNRKGYRVTNFDAGTDQQKMWTAELMETSCDPQN